MTGKLFLFSAMVFAGILFACGEAGAANTYTLAVPPGLTAVMGDARLVVPVTITNTGNQDYIGYVKISFDAGIYYVGNDTTQPPGWQMTFPVTNGAGLAFAEFEVINPADPTYRIDPGESMTFFIVITGPKSGSDYLPILSDTADVTDHVLDKCNIPAKASEMRKNRTSALFTQDGVCGTCAGGQVQDCFARKALYASITAVPLTVGGGGQISVILTVSNRSTVVQGTVQPSSPALTVNPAGTAGATLASGPTPGSAGPIAVGASTIFQWTYTASGSGSLQFCSSARNASGNATSPTVCTNPVSVGDFTASLTIDPASILSGQTTTVSMKVTNNGPQVLRSITPTLTPPGAPVTAVRVSGPMPGSIGNLSPGSTSVFIWAYSVSGSGGNTFVFSGLATDQNGQTTTPAPVYSNQGLIGLYTLSLDPTTVFKGSTNVTFAFTVRNGGGNSVTQVQIYTAVGSPVFPNPTGTSSGCGGTPSISGGIVTFSNVAAFPAGGACTFTVTYPTMPNVTVNSDYNFLVKVWDTLTPANKDPRANLGAIVKVTSSGITLDAIPDALGPACSSLLIATVSPAPSDGSRVVFSGTAGTITDVTTTTAGEAYATLRAPRPYDAALPAATVRATYQDAVAGAAVTFQNVSSCLRKIRWREILP